MADRPWTMTEIDRAVNLRLAGKTRAQIAVELGRTEDAIRSVMTRQNVRLMDSAAWSEAEDAIILARGNKSWADVAANVCALGRERSISACRSRDRALAGRRTPSVRKKRKAVTNDDVFVRAVLKGWAELQGLKVAA